MLRCNKHIHIIAASDAVIKAGQQTIGIRWQIKTYHICLLICNMVKEAWILMCESIMILLPYI